MNIMDLIKNIKNFEELLRSVKEELRLKKETIQKDNISITFNGLGEIIEITHPQDMTLDSAKSILIELINQTQDMARDNILKEINKRFGGLFGF